jgi:aryl-alcohol dehydrogenase-like predicted oxidoreductase
VAEKASLSMTHLALAWVLRRPEVTSAIMGSSKPEHVEDNAAASGITLDDALLAAIDEALGDAVGP